MLLVVNQDSKLKILKDHNRYLLNPLSTSKGYANNLDIKPSLSAPILPSSLYNAVLKEVEISSALSKNLISFGSCFNSKVAISFPKHKT
jgi:hypothetical protein